MESKIVYQSPTKTGTIKLAKDGHVFYLVLITSKPSSKPETKEDIALSAIQEFVPQKNGFILRLAGKVKREIRFEGRTTWCSVWLTLFDTLPSIANVDWETQNLLSLTVIQKTMLLWKLYIEKNPAIFEIVSNVLYIAAPEELLAILEVLSNICIASASNTLTAFIQNIYPLLTPAAYEQVKLKLRNCGSSFFGSLAVEASTLPDNEPFITTHTPTNNLKDAREALETYLTQLRSNFRPREVAEQLTLNLKRTVGVVQLSAFFCRMSRIKGLRDIALCERYRLFQENVLNSFRCVLYFEDRDLLQTCCYYLDVAHELLKLNNLALSAIFFNIVRKALKRQQITAEVFMCQRWQQAFVNMRLLFSSHAQFSFTKKDVDYPTYPDIDSEFRFYRRIIHNNESKSFLLEHARNLLYMDNHRHLKSYPFVGLCSSPLPSFFLFFFHFLVLTMMMMTTTTVILITWSRQ